MATQSRNLSREPSYVFENAGAQTPRRWTALERLRNVSSSLRLMYVLPERGRVPQGDVPFSIQVSLFPDS